MEASRWDVVVVGAGVLGTFHACFACQRGLRTLLIERGSLRGRPRKQQTDALNGG